MSAPKTPAASPTVRVQSPARISPGQTVAIRVAIAHPMVTGQQNDDQGRRQIRNILTRFECHGPAGLLWAMDLHPAMAANPSLQFFLRPSATMTLSLRWWGDQGFEHEHTHELVVT